MTLTAAQKADVRRFAGYSVMADLPSDDFHDYAYIEVIPGAFQSLNHRLNNLRVEEEAVLTGTYLTNLTALEAAIVGAAANLDTDQAAVWTRNRSEVSDRMALFDGWRLRMCGFLGVAAGPAIAGSCGPNVALVRR
jgi:hypothetical protein